jgi:hypothetical protein
LARYGTAKDNNVYTIKRRSLIAKNGKNIHVTKKKVWIDSKLKKNLFCIAGSLAFVLSCLNVGDKTILYLQ